MKSRIPIGVWVLGFVSMLMDISSEMIHSLLPLFMVGTLGASVFMVGLLDGLAEATALLVRVFSGAWSDFLGRRKGLAVLGYGLGALSKPLFAVASGVTPVLAARLLDRIGKGIRGAPRDALIADMTPADIRGAAFGLRQSLDTIGAFIGPLLAVGLMIIWANDFRVVFWVAVVPGVLAVTLLLIGVRDPVPVRKVARINPLSRERMSQLGRRYWQVVVLGEFFTLARFSESFLILRAEQSGVALSLVPLVMVLMNVVYSLTAYPFGRLADRVSHTKLLSIGLVILIVADVSLAINDSLWMTLAGVILWGVHMGMTQGLFAMMIAEAAPADLRGTAFGIFSLMSGVAMLVASATAGLLWDRFGAASTFHAGAIIGLLALVFTFGLAVRTRRPKR